MKPEFEGMLRTVTQRSQWEYKGKHYIIMTVTPGMLSQDPDLGEWVPTVIYTTLMEHAKNETYHVGLDLRFARPITEFMRKFKKIEF